VHIHKWSTRCSKSFFFQNDTSGMRKREKCRQHLRRAPAVYISRVLSNFRYVLWQSITWFLPLYHTFLFPLFLRSSIPFQQTHHLVNPWNDHKKVQISRDGQVRQTCLLHWMSLQLNAHGRLYIPSKICWVNDVDAGVGVVLVSEVWLLMSVQLHVSARTVPAGLHTSHTTSHTEMYEMWF